VGYLQWLLDAAHSGGMYGCDYENNKYGSADFYGGGDTYDSCYADGNYGYFNSGGKGHGHAYGFPYIEDDEYGDSGAGYGEGDYIE
jgi:hypothetical protein